MLTIKAKTEALKNLKEYNGMNPYILSLKRDVLFYKKPDTLNNFAVEYINSNLDYQPRVINKTIKVADWWGEKKQVDWGLDFVPQKIRIFNILGETKTTYHCYAQYRQSVQPNFVFIPKKAVLTPFWVEDYHNIQVDFERYDRLSDSSSRISDSDVNGRTHHLLPHQKEAIQFLLNRKKCVLADDMGLGKLEPVSALIPTPQGFKKMGNIERGDFVFGCDGKKHKVLEVFPHKDKEIYKVTFSDGTSAECGLEHLWTVRTKNMGKRGQEWKVMSLKELIDSGLQYNDKTRIEKDLSGRNKYEIPICESVEYPEKEYLISPYVLGTDIGEFIPEEYKLGSINQRLELLRGLMDSNGSIGSKNTIRFDTTSKTLAEDVMELVYSLGGIARLDIEDGSKEGKPIEYFVLIDLKINPIHLTKEVEKYHTVLKKEYSKFIVSAEYVRNEDAKCIMVDSEDHTYLTGRNYIVTHNTTSLSVAAIEGNFDSIIIICPASLKTNWKKELMWYIPERDITIVEGVLGKNKKELETALGYGIGKSGKTTTELQDELRERGKWIDNRFVIINYDILDDVYKIPTTRSKENIEKAYNESPMLQYAMGRKTLLILDEAHLLSKSTSIRFKTIKDFIKRSNPDSIYLSTGTPITNDPENYFNMLSIIGQNITDDWAYYMKRYCGATEICKDKNERDYWTSNFLRAKGKTTWYNLTDIEKVELREYLKKHCKMILIKNNPTNLDELKERTSHIYLRRVKEDNSALTVTKNIHEVYYTFNQLQWVEYSRLWSEYEEERKSLQDAEEDKELNKNLLEGALYRKYCSNQMIPNTVKLCNKLLEQGRKVIIICCYDEELYALKDIYGDSCVIYNGKLQPKQKEIAKDEFINDPDKKIFIGNLKACGVGLTLTVSNALVFNNISFTPSENRQAEDRVFRIGQQKNVDIYYQMFQGTQYEHIWNTVLKKELSINQVIKKETEK